MRSSNHTKHEKNNFFNTKFAVLFGVLAFLSLIREGHKLTENYYVILDYVIHSW